MIITQPKYFKDAFHFDIARVCCAVHRVACDSINAKLHHYVVISLFVFAETTKRHQVFVTL